MTSPLPPWAWDALGWAGQGVFTWRVLDQWFVSERLKRSVVPRSFWSLSLVGTALVLAYAASRLDPVFVVGSLAQGAIFARNLFLSRPRPPGAGKPPATLVPTAILLALLVGVAVAALAFGRGAIDRAWEAPWLAVGFAGQAVWFGRFLVQWWTSEREGESRLPAAFFRMSIVGALLLLAYAVSQRDLVNIAAYALNPIPYARNLVLLRREAAR